MYHLLVPGSTGLLNSLKGIGSANDAITVHLSERDGVAFEDAVRGKVPVDYLPFQAGGQVLRTASVTTVKFIWPAADEG